MALNNQYFLQILSMIKNGSNPQQIVLNMLESRAANNPIMSNLLSLAKQNDTQGIETVVRNIARERGIDYDQAFQEFKKTLNS